VPDLRARRARLQRAVLYLVCATRPGARTLDELHERAVVGVQSPAGYAEGAPVPQSW
jgi:hypothetical protein